MNRLRDRLLELWSLLPLALACAITGPFGTFTLAPFAVRIAYWVVALLIAWLIFRPAIALLARASRPMRLPEGPAIFWGLIVLAVPVAAAWTQVSGMVGRADLGFGQAYALSAISALAVFAGERMAYALKRRLSAAPAIRAAPIEAFGTSSAALGDVTAVIALESEDHYVRVHCVGGSRLVLMRLRDAVADLGAIDGAQVHRRWWVARRAIERVEPEGRGIRLRLTGGLVVPVARDSIARLQRAGFLPASIRNDPLSPHKPN